MKKYFSILVVAVLFHGLAFGQSAVPMSKIKQYPKYTFTDTVRMKGVPQEELYARAWNWFNDQTKTDPSFFEEAHIGSGRFAGTSSLPFRSKLSGGNDFVRGKIYFLVHVHVHDQYYVYEFTDFVHQARLTFNTLTTSPKYPYRPVANKDWHNMVWEEIKISVKDYTYPLIGSLRASMQKESEQFAKILSQQPVEISLEELHNADVQKLISTPKTNPSVRPVAGIPPSQAKKPGVPRKK